MQNIVKLKSSPFEQYSNMIRRLRFLAKFVGADVLNPNYTLNWISLMVAISIILYFICTVYTIAEVFAERWTIMLEAFCMVGSVLQGITKFITAVSNRNSYIQMHNFLLKTYGEYQVKGVEYNKALTRCIHNIRTLVKSLAILYCFLILCIVTVPIGYLIFTKKRLLIMQFYVPGIDVNTRNGYLLTLGAHTMCMFFGAFGNFAADSVILIYFVHLRIFVQIFKLKVGSLNEFVEDNNMRTSPKTQDLLIECITWHQEYNHFTDTCNSSFYWNVGAQVSTSALSIILTLVIIFTGEWPGGYAYIVFCFAGLYLYCGMGTVVEICNDNFTTDIYEINWYNLSVPHQKMVRIMLMRSQSPVTVDVFGVMPLSVSTGLQVTKTVYSVFMLLLNFF